MEVKHTPGPWGVWHGRVFAGPFKKIPGGIKGFRAEICEMDDLDLDEEEIEANAHLIAAAPDLLEALEDLMEAVKDHYAAGGYEWKQARAAIAKAKGEAQ